MSMTATCPTCRLALRLNQNFPAGTMIKCPKCSATFSLPAVDQKSAPPAAAPQRSAPSAQGITSAPRPAAATTPAASAPVGPPVEPAATSPSAPWLAKYGIKLQNRTLLLIATGV